MLLPSNFVLTGDKGVASSLKGRANQFSLRVANQAKLGGVSLNRNLLLDDGSTINVVTRKDGYGNYKSYITIFGNSTPIPSTTINDIFVTVSDITNPVLSPYTDDTYPPYQRLKGRLIYKDSIVPKTVSDVYSGGGMYEWSSISNNGDYQLNTGIPLSTSLLSYPNIPIESGSYPLTSRSWIGGGEAISWNSPSGKSTVFYKNGESSVISRPIDFENVLGMCIAKSTTTFANGYLFALIVLFKVSSSVNLSIYGVNAGTAPYYNVTQLSSVSLSSLGTLGTGINFTGFTSDGLKIAQWSGSTITNQTIDILTFNSNYTSFTKTTPIIKLEYFLNSHPIPSQFSADK